MERYYKLSKIPSEETKFKKLYFCKNNTWDTQGTLYTDKQLLALLKSKIANYSGIESLPLDWHIEEFYITHSKSTTIKWFIQNKSNKPIIPGL